MTLENVLLETRGAIAIVTLNRPKALNALSSGLIRDLGLALDEIDNNSDIRAVILTGSERAFAAGADIKEMANKNFTDVFIGNLFADLSDRIARFRKPIIAAVAGYALGGGCELAMMCDFIIAADNAIFGQPEITLGVIPGIGGTQRLTRAVGKAKAMDLVLSGRQMDAAEAERAGLASRIVPVSEVLSTAIEAAERIAGFSLPAVMMAKEAINIAFETTLAQGVQFERRLFHAGFALDDQKEGMAAFVEKRPAKFSHR